MEDLHIGLCDSFLIPNQMSHLTHQAQQLLNVRHKEKKKQRKKQKKHILFCDIAVRQYANSVI